MSNFLPQTLVCSSLSVLPYQKANQGPMSWVNPILTHSAGIYPTIFLSSDPYVVLPPYFVLICTVEFIYIFKYLYIHTYIHVYIYVYIYIHLYTYIHTYKYIQGHSGSIVSQNSTKYWETSWSQCYINFQCIVIGRNFPNSFYEITITLVPKPDNDSILKKNLQTRNT